MYNDRLELNCGKL